MSCLSNSLHSQCRFGDACRGIAGQGFRKRKGICSCFFEQSARRLTSGSATWGAAGSCLVSEQRRVPASNWRERPFGGVLTGSQGECRVSLTEIGGPQAAPFRRELRWQEARRSAVEEETRTTAFGTKPGVAAPGAAIMTAIMTAVGPS